MPIFRGSKGGSDKVDPDDAVTKIMDRSKQQNVPADDLPTKINQAAKQSMYEQKENAKTVLYQPKAAGEEEHETTFDPVVGWLVIIKGPGLGVSLTLGYGKNGIGRSNAERVSLDFGDNSDSLISRSKHTIITYDPKGKKYYIQSGDSINLTYLDETPVLAVTELLGGENIIIGKTTLRFVAFCGEEFNWQQKEG